MISFFLIGLLFTSVPTQLHDTQQFTVISRPVDNAAEFQKYWKNFRDAVMNDDYNLLSSMTHFPLIAKGTLDEDPVVKVPKAKFEKMMSLSLKQITGLNVDNLNETVIEYIKATETITFSETKVPMLNGNSASVANMEFTFKAGEWKLTRIYITDETRAAYKK